MSRRVCLSGETACRPPVEELLRSAGWQITSEMVAAPDLLICFHPEAGSPRALRESWRRYAATLPAARPDDSGELRAQGAVVLIAAVSGDTTSGLTSPTAPAPDAALAELRAACLELGPDLRLNALLVPVENPGDAAAPALLWLAEAAAVTGQVIRRDSRSQVNHTASPG